MLGRLLNLLIAGLILAGAVLLMVVGVVFFALRRLFGRPAVMPRFQRSVGPAPTHPARPTAAERGDVIDVVATEVKE